MVALTAVLVTLLLVSSTVTSPVPSQTFSVGDRLPFPPFDPRGLLCHLPIIKKALCPRQAPSGPSVKTPIGIALGTTLSSGAARFAVKYGSAQSWQLSSVASDWELPCASTSLISYVRIYPPAIIETTGMDPQTSLPFLWLAHRTTPIHQIIRRIACLCFYTFPRLF